MVCPLRIPPSRNAYYSVCTHHVCETELMGLTIGWLKLPDVCGTWYVWYGMNRHMLAVILGVTSTADTFSTNPVYQTLITHCHEQPKHKFLPETLNWHSLSNSVFPPTQKGSTQVSRKYQMSRKAIHIVVKVVCKKWVGNILIRSWEKLNVVVMSINYVPCKLNQWSKCLCSPVWHIYIASLLATRDWAWCINSTVARWDN